MDREGPWGPYLDEGLWGIGLGDYLLAFTRSTMAFNNDQGL